MKRLPIWVGRRLEDILVSALRRVLTECEVTIKVTVRPRNEEPKPGA